MCLYRKLLGLFVSQVSNFSKVNKDTPTAISFSSLKTCYESLFAQKKKKKEKFVG